MSGLPILLAAAVLVGVCLSTSGREAEAQVPEEFTNLQVFPEDIERTELLVRMRKFSFALGVRCQHCHYSESGSFQDIDFASDENPTKDKARYMIEMLRTINDDLLPGMEGRGDPPVQVTCKTCHRSRARPFLLSQEMLMATHEAGADSAAALYRDFRENLVRGRFDFGEWETNTVAEDLAREGYVEEAITIYELNSEYYPESISIHSALAEHYEQLGRKEDAIAAWERVLEIRPDHGGASSKLAELKGN